MNKFHRRFFFLYALGIFLCVFPVTIAIIFYFPLWAGRGAATLLSGFSLILIIMAAVPLIKFAKQIFKSPAAYLMWFAAFTVFFMLSRIANDMTVICFVGFTSNILGAGVCKLAESCKRKGEMKNERQV